MPEISLAKTVPLVYEPKRQHLWTATFGDIGIQPFALQSFEAPKYSTNSTEIKYLNTTSYVGGQFQWGSMNLVIRDFVAPSMAQTVMEWVRLASESATGRAGYASGYLKNITLDHLDGTGVSISRWILNSCLLTDVDFGSLSYESDGLLTISMTLQPQNCILLY